MSTAEPSSPNGKTRRSSQVRGAVDLIASLAMIAAASVILWNKFVAPNLAEKSRNPIPTRLVSLETDTVKGSTNARIAVVEYSDFQCPFCAAFSQSVLPVIDKSYVNTGKIRFAFKQFPLTRVHPESETVARAAVCAARAQKFWPMHDSLFADQTKLSMADLTLRASALGLPGDEFSKCIVGAGADAVATDTKEALEFRIDSTPTFLVGTITPDGRVKVSHRLSGSQQDGELVRLLERLLK